MVKPPKAGRWCALFGMFALLWPAIVAGQFSDWRTFTDMRSPSRLAASADILWGGTSGGVLQFSKSTGGFDLFTNAEGLLSNSVSAVAVDKLGRLWVGLEDGNINILDPATGAVDLVSDYQSFRINDIFAKGDTIYIAFVRGVGEYRLDRDETTEVYFRLGVALPSDVPARKLLVHDRVLFVATESGVAAANLEQPNLKAPNSWRNETTQQGLPSNAITAFSVYDGAPVAATAAGVAIREGESWRNVTGNLPGGEVVALAARSSALQTTLFAATSSGVFSTDDLAGWEALPATPGAVQDLTVSEGELWAAAENTGLARFDESGELWASFLPNTPKTDVYSGVTFDSQSQLWAVSTRDRFVSFDGAVWQNYDDLVPELGSTRDYRAVVVDDADRVWMATFGGGIKVAEQSDGMLQVTTIDTTGGLLSGSTSANTGFVVVNDLHKDRNGTIWISNFQALSGRPIAAVTPLGEWAYFSRANGLVARGGQTSRVFADRFDRVWYGTLNDGVGILDYGGTLLDGSDDQLALGLVDIAQLFNPAITGLAEDLDGTMWIGTEEGLNFWFANAVSRQFGLISPDIRVVRVDPANNKWIGTSGGVSILSADNFTLTALTTQNSPLVSNSVTDFAFDGATGDVFIATTNGLSRVRTPFTRGREDFNQLRGFPNPFQPGTAGTGFTIANIVRGAGVHIYSEDGRLMRAFAPGDIPGGQVSWDGRSDAGTLVPSGIYIFVAYLEGGASAAGKVAVVRP